MGEEDREIPWDGMWDARALQKSFEISERDSPCLGWLEKRLETVSRRTMGMSILA